MVVYRPVVGIGVVIAASVGAVLAALAVSVAPAAWATRLRPGAVLRAE
jgi:hypothetical protein